MGLSSVLIMLSGVVFFFGILLLGWNVWLGAIGWLACSGVVYKLTKPRDPSLEKSPDL